MIDYFVFELGGLPPLRWTLDKFLMSVGLIILTGNHDRVYTVAKF